MTDRDFIFAITYHYYQENKIKTGMEWYYSNILYGVNGQQSAILPPIYFKRLYNKLKDEALELLEDNISYCEARLQIDKNKQR